MTTVGEIVRGQELARLPSSSTIREAARYMIEHGVGSVLVMDDESLRGIFTERDALRIFVATRRNSDYTHLDEVMTEAPQTLPPDATAQEAAQRMAAGKFPTHAGGRRRRPYPRGGLAKGSDRRRGGDGLIEPLSGTPGRAQSCRAPIRR